jgi:hypothetical protein
VSELLNELKHNRVGIHKFAEKDPSLEDVFMMVTMGLVTWGRLRNIKSRLKAYLQLGH